MSRLQLHLNKWLPRARPLRLDRHNVIHSPSRTGSATGVFETLAVNPSSPTSRSLPNNADVVPVKLDTRPHVRPKTFLGVELPVKPLPPGDEECCQSGCAICVYDLYLADTQYYHEALSSALDEVWRRIKSQGLVIRPEDWPAELGKMEPEEEGNEGEVDAKKKAEKALEKVTSSLDPSLRAFLEMEARMKAKQRQREQEALASGGTAGDGTVSSSPNT